MPRRLAALGLVLLATAGLAHAAEPRYGVSFPEGFTVRLMTDRVAAVRKIVIRKYHRAPRLTGSAYAAAAARTKAPFGPRKSVEGFLFPSLYYFGPSSSADDLIRLQRAAFDKAWATIDLGGRKPYDVLTVASMVERETKAPEERPLVAAVIYNRLAKGMPLGIDATLRYGLGIQGTRALTKQQLASDTPYNTSRFKGLPPTPIGNPGLPSLRAAAHPAAVDYLFYVRKPDRVHHFFTADEAEFCAKAREYGYRGC